MSDVLYGRDEWLGAIDAAETAEWDEIDAGDRHGPLAAWICYDAIDYDQVGRDVDVITAAVNALRDTGRDVFSTDDLIKVLRSSLGEVWDDCVPPGRDGRGLVLAKPEGSGSLAKYLFDTAKW